jgi:hypothetical protein
MCASRLCLLLHSAAFCPVNSAARRKVWSCRDEVFWRWFGVFGVDIILLNFIEQH